MAEIEVIISADGTPTFNGKGFQGNSCQEAMKPFERIFENGTMDVLPNDESNYHTEELEVHEEASY